MAFIQTSRQTTTLRSKARTTLNVVTILSCMLATFKLVYLGVFGVETAALILLAVVVFVALSNPYAKLVLVLIGIYLFVRTRTGLDVRAFEQAITQVGVLAAVLIGLYFVVRSMFK